MFFGGSLSLNSALVFKYFLHRTTAIFYYNKGSLKITKKLVLKHLLSVYFVFFWRFPSTSTATGMLSELSWNCRCDYRSVYVCYKQEICQQVRKFLPGWHHHLHYSCRNRHSYTLLSASIYCKTHSHRVFVRVCHYTRIYHCTSCCRLAQTQTLSVGQFAWLMAMCWCQAASDSAVASSR